MALQGLTSELRLKESGGVGSYLLLIDSFGLDQLIGDYHQFFLSLLPFVFMLAVLIEYFDRCEPFSLLKRAAISILILTSVGNFYKTSIISSIETADTVLNQQKGSNLLLMNLLDGTKSFGGLKVQRKGKQFYKDNDILGGTIAFFKHHIFDSFVNDGFTISIFFIIKLCLLILKVVYSLVYYLGFGLIGIPCLIFLFPSMGNVLRGAILSFLWCLVVPHILVFILSMIGSEINKGYVAGQIIGGSMMGTSLLFILALFTAFSPLIGAMILNGSGISQAGGIIGTIGANYVLNFPRNTINQGAALLTTGRLGPKTALAFAGARQGYRLAKGAVNLISRKGGNNDQSVHRGSSGSQTSKNSSRHNGDRGNHFSNNGFNHGINHKQKRGKNNVWV